MAAESGTEQIYSIILRAVKIYAALEGAAADVLRSKNPKVTIPSIRNDFLSRVEILDARNRIPPKLANNIIGAYLSNRDIDANTRPTSHEKKSQLYSAAELQAVLYWMDHPDQAVKYQIDVMRCLARRAAQ